VRMSSSTNTINPKPCNYGCGTRIYWNTLENAYFEVFTKQKHNCPNRSKSIKHQTTTNTNKPNYYNRFTKQPKPKMSNSLELLSGSISEIQKKYEILSDIVSEVNGKVHGSQSHIMQDNNISLIVYYEVPDGQREMARQKFNNTSEVIR
jgi:hypothetical protein